jgi:hypothetical protein
MVVVPQFPLWFRADDEDSDVEETLANSDDEMDLFLYPEERDADEQDAELGGSVDELENDVNSSCADADVTTDSMVTVPDGNAADLFPDFVVIHLLAKRLPMHHPRFTPLSGIQITHQCCPLVVENKRFPKRSLIGPQFNVVLEALLGVAKNDLGYQYYHLFKQYRHAISTIAIAAAGDYWTHRTVHRDEVPKLVGDFFDVSEWEDVHWPPHVVLGTPISNKRLMEIHEVLQGKPRLNLDGSCG